MIPLLPISYLPPVSYVALCVQSGNIILEKHEHYVKQTHRNRALIYGANGILPLIIPVQHRNLFNIPIEKVLIANDTPWQKVHWRSIVSAYRNAAFFEYFEDDFEVFYRQEFNTLYEFNLELMKMIFRFLGGDIDISYTTLYEKEALHATDFRNSTDFFSVPEKKSNTAKSSYRQVFSDIHGFIPELSIVDLLFNEGTNCKEYLTQKPQ